MTPHFSPRIDLSVGLAPHKRLSLDHFDQPARCTGIESLDATNRQPFSYSIALRRRPIVLDNPSKPVILNDTVRVARPLCTVRQGAVAQLGERYNRTVEVRGSSPLSSIIFLLPTWARGTVGSAPQWHCGGRGFESLRVHFFLDTIQVKKAANRSSRLFPAASRERPGGSPAIGARGKRHKS
jgi:hypothetical protein